MRSRLVRPVLAVLFLSLIFFPFAAGAQSPNLLTNPGFDPPFNTVSGNPPPQVAQGWTPWYMSGGQSASENQQPEYYAASNLSGLGVPRIRSGSDAQQYFSFYQTHDGGLYQRVNGVTGGAQLRFTAYVYVWSSTYDDVNKSEAPGGVVVQVGIDPTGGTSGESANIVWSPAGGQYDAYNAYSVTATASGSAVTVFVRTTVTEPVRNTNVYVDDASLVVVGQPTAVPTATATKTPTLPATNTPIATNTPDDLGIVTLTPTATVTPTLPPTDIPVASATPTQDVIVVTATPITPIPTATFGFPSTPVSNTFPGTVYYTVKRGDTVGQIATLYGSDIDAIIMVNGLNQSAFIQVGQVLAVPVRVPVPVSPTPSLTPVLAATLPPLGGPITGTVYTVQSGENLFRIALRSNTTVTTLARLNGIVNPNLIYAGQRLLIPTGLTPVATPTPVVVAPRTILVQPGDTLFRIALRARVSLAQLIQVNGILDPNLIFVGQILVIP